MPVASPLVAVIVDVTRSREHDDRAALQRSIEEAFDGLNRTVVAQQQLEATIGDEFQAVYADLPSALRATLLARLLLPVGIECRFGIGRGDIVDVGQGVAGRIQDGSAWWAAREAINEARSREYGRQPFVRTWFAEAATSEALVNAFLLCRDQLVDSLNPRARRLLLGRLQGTPQRQLAEAEGVSQSAVSQTLRRSGALALIASEELLSEVAA